jgi:hypothetical protein
MQIIILGSRRHDTSISDSDEIYYANVCVCVYIYIFIYTYISDSDEIYYANVCVYTHTHTQEISNDTRNIFNSIDSKITIC